MSMRYPNSHAPTSFKEGREVVIKTCLVCGHTQRLPHRFFECPQCSDPSMFFFKNNNHLIGFINNYGLGKLNIIDEDIRDTVLAAFA